MSSLRPPSEGNRCHSRTGRSSAHIQPEDRTFASPETRRLKGPGPLDLFAADHVDVTAYWAMAATVLGAE